MGEAPGTIEQWEGMCRSIVNRYSAPGFDKDDMLQEARIGALKGLRDWRADRDASMSAFIYLCIERNVQSAVMAANTIKRRGHNEALSLDAPPPPDTEYHGSEPLGTLVSGGGPSISRQLHLRDEVLAVFHDVRTMLSPIERNAWEGVYMYDLSYDELGPRKMIDNALQRARQKLTAARNRRRLREGGIGRDDG